MDYLIHPDISEEIDNRSMCARRALWQFLFCVFPSVATSRRLVVDGGLGSNTPIGWDPGGIDGYQISGVPEAASLSKNIVSQTYRLSYPGGREKQS